MPLNCKNRLEMQVAAGITRLNSICLPDKKKFSSQLCFAEIIPGLSSAKAGYHTKDLDQ